MVKVQSGRKWLARVMALALLGAALAVYLVLRSSSSGGETADEPTPLLAPPAESDLARLRVGLGATARLLVGVAHGGPSPSGVPSPFTRGLPPGRL